MIAVIMKYLLNFVLFFLRNVGAKKEEIICNGEGESFLEPSSL